MKVWMDVVGWLVTSGTDGSYEKLRLKVGGDLNLKSKSIIF